MRTARTASRTTPPVCSFEGEKAKGYWPVPTLMGHGAHSIQGARAALAFALKGWNGHRHAVRESQGPLSPRFERALLGAIGPQPLRSSCTYVQDVYDRMALRLFLESLSTDAQRWAALRIIQENLAFLREG